MTREALEALAARCEQASAGEQAEMIADALRLVRDRSLVAREVNLIHDGGYVDAALTLVPEGWFGLVVEAWRKPDTGETQVSVVINTDRLSAAPTLALAIAAAALRAHAAKEGE